jgi:hypothetical protein
MLRNQNPRGSACSGIQTEIPLWGVNIRRNVSRIKLLKALFETENPPDLGGQYAPQYPRNARISPMRFSTVPLSWEV